MSVVSVKSPGTGGIAIIVAAILGVIAVSAFFISRSLSGIQLPSLPSLPSFPDITFPSFDIQFPSIEFPSIEFPSIEFPSFEFPSIPGITGPVQEIPTLEIGEVAEPGSLLEGFIGGPQGPQLPPDKNLFQTVFEILFGQPATPAEEFVFERADLPPTAGSLESLFGPGGSLVQPAIAEEEGFQTQPIDIIQDPGVQTTLETGQQFEGGGVGFIGGFVTETPIEFLSLNQIIEMGLASTASEAASLRAEAIGFTPAEEEFLGQGPVDVMGFVSGGPPQVSDPQFEGLSAEEIALRLTGGPISNF